MLLSAVHKEKGEEKLNLLMLNDAIPAGAKALLITNRASRRRPGFRFSPENGCIFEEKMI